MSRSTTAARFAEKEVFHTVGLPDAAVRESRDRVRAAIKNSGYLIPPTFITINLAPADSRKKDQASICPSLSDSWAPMARSGPLTSASSFSSASSASTAACVPSPACCPSPFSRAKKISLI
jgi:hypothetical protein